MRLFSGWFTALVVLIIGLGVPPAPGVRATDGQLEKKHKDAKAQTLRGTLQSADNQRIKVRTGANMTAAVQLDSQTQITIDGKKSALTDLKAGQTVVCTFVRREGVSTALTITATSPKR